jgi:hypothetical protein
MKSDFFTELFSKSDKSRPAAEGKNQPKPEASPKKPGKKKSFGPAMDSCQDRISAAMR